MLLSTESVRVLRRDTYTDPSTLAPGERPIARRDGSLVEYVDLVPESAPESATWRVTLDAGVNGEAPEGAVGSATIRQSLRQEAALSRDGRTPYIRESAKFHLVSFTPDAGK
jgi:hypothetical protein